VLRRLLVLAVLTAPSTLHAQTSDDAEAEASASDEGTVPSDDGDADADAGADEDRLDAVYVGRRAPEPLGEASPAVTTVDDRELLERPIETIGDAIDEEPGVHLQATNRGAGAPIIRGQVGPGVLYLYDGMRFNDGTLRTGPNQYLNLFDPYGLDGIEVLRGGGGVLYGSNTIGGVVSLDPRIARFDEGVNGRVVTGFQSADTSWFVAPEAGWDNGTFGVLVGGGFRDFGELRTGGGDTAPGSEYSSWSARASAGWRPSRGTTLHLNWSGLAIDDAGRADRLYQSSFRRYDDDNHHVWARLSHDGDDAFDQVEARAWVNLRDEFIVRHDCNTSDVYGLTDTDGDPIEVTTDVPGCVNGDADAVGRIRENTDSVTTIGSSLSILSTAGDTGLGITWGLDATHSTVRSDRFDLSPVDPATSNEFERGDERRGNFADESTYQQYGAFAVVQYEAPVGSMTLTPEVGARASHIRAFAPDVSDELGDVDYSHTGIVSSARIRAQVTPDVGLHLGWNQGFRAPNLQETTVLGDTGNTYEIPNDNLGPERSDNVELGARVAMDPVQIEATGFYMVISDAITREDATLDGQAEIDGTRVVRRINADSATWYGAELAARTQDFAGVSLRGNVSYIRGEVDVDGETEPARRSPPVRWLAAVRYTLSMVDAWAEVLVEGAGAATRINSGDEGDLRICTAPGFPGVLQSELGDSCSGTPAWVNLGIRLGYDFNDHLTVRASVSNLLDEPYRTHGSGLDAPGLNAALTLEGRF